MSTSQETKVLIIGAGAAGLTAAIYAARANLSPVVIQGLQPGGQLTITTDVENYPGFAEVIQGPWLMEQMAPQAAHCGAELLFDLVTEIDLSARPFRARLDGGDTVLADAVIIATGAQARWLGMDSERHFSGAGVSACATCDGFFFRGKPVAIVGGGNTAVEEAIYLAQMCEKVTLIHRRDSLRAEKVMQERLFANPQDRGAVGPRGRGGARHRDAQGGDRRAGAPCPHRRDPRSCRSRGCSSPSATIRPRRCSRASSRWTRRATS